MGILSWLFGSSRGRANAVGKWSGRGAYDFDVVGESAYQDGLDRICGGKTDDGHEFRCIAVLIPEPDNAYDENAIAVQIRGVAVGYLPRRSAVEYARNVRAAGLPLRAYRCDAVIVGGWLRDDGDEGSYGVKLDISLPLSLM